MVFSSRLAAQPIWWRVVGLPLLGSCQLAPQTAPNCSARAHFLAVARDTFDLNGPDSRTPEQDSLRLPFAHQQRFLRGAYFVGNLLTDSMAPSPYGGGAYYYGQVRALLRSPRVSCHQVVYVTSDEFGACFWSLATPTGPPTCSYPGAWAPLTRTKVTSICMIPPAGRCSTTRLC